MGILDDAIREHLELKRKHGADSSDLQRLESEAFGPAVRPGDPEFEGQEEPAADTPEAPPGDTAADAPAPGSEEGGDWLAALEDKLEEAPVDSGPEAGGPELADEGTGESPAEQARIDHSHLADTVDHPAVPDPETGESLAEPAEAPEAAIFEAADDAGDDAELADLDLDLDLDEPDPTPSEPDSTEFELELPADDGPVTAEQPEADLEETAETPLEEPPAREEPPEEPAPEPVTGEEDLLEETPEFLKEAPDGESLWFEQAPPKDFDFDED